MDDTQAQRLAKAIIRVALASVGHEPEGATPEARLESIVNELERKYPDDGGVDKSATPSSQTPESETSATTAEVAVVEPTETLPPPSAAATTSGTQQEQSSVESEGEGVAAQSTPVEAKITQDEGAKLEQMQVDEATASSESKGCCTLV
eukprot:m.80793 g.80793  ORF g.80793 m.80793 type:complete len:149 (+) comp12613_c1_seq2:2053-2499(+)